MMMATPRADNQIEEVEADLHEIQPVLEANEEIQIQPASTEFDDYSRYFDVDGRTKRKGTFWTATAHITTAVISLGGVLTLTWAMAQLGWIFGPIAMVLFTAVNCYTSILLTHCYRRDESVTGRTNSYTYTDAVKSILGGRHVQICGLFQYLNICGIAIGFTIAASTSMMAIERTHCMHVAQAKDPCDVSGKSRMYMILFGLVEMVLSHLSNLNKVSWLSIIATIMSLIYSGIGLGLGMAKVAENGISKRSLTGISTDTIPRAQKIWKRLQALGAIAFAYSFSITLIEIQDTIKSPAEHNTMKRASVVSIVSVTAFYLLCGSIGYASFGDYAPENLLAGFGSFYYDRLYWLVDIANLAVVVHLIGAYQVFSQPLLAFVENWVAHRWSGSEVFTEDGLSVFRPIWRTSFVVFTTCMAMAFPSFTYIIGTLGAFGFWSLAVYLPITMYLSEKKILRWTRSWVGHQMLNGCVLMISILAAIGTIVRSFDVN
ncbi:amino acid permease 4-like [Trifolium pratense]|uniref:amino acid permease 4-like n=1 Tax=Trifolium pratense TaxID=57577 RepID=UPI001E697366|nr:amino acid permease 4-like [Trifolium pratense]